MFPPSTSLIPVQIALARFWESYGWLAVGSNYPYWYLGTTPFRYLTGPILPSLLVGLHQVFPSLSLFSIFFLVFSICWLVGGMGVYFLVRELTPGVSRRRLTTPGVAAAVFYLFGPILPFLFRFADGLYLIAFSFLPLTLLAYMKFLHLEQRRWAILFIFMLVLEILLNSLIIPTLVLGMVAILLAVASWGEIERLVKRTFLYFIFSLLISTLWYTPGYWLTLLGTPSLVGKGLVGVIGELAKLLPIVVALTAAVFSAKIRKGRQPLGNFIFYWLTIFGFLTFWRFLSDPDFWLDWTAYGTELQLGMAIVFALIMQNLKSKTFNFLLALRSKVLLRKILLTFEFLLFTFIFNKYVLGTFQKNITSTVEYKMGKELEELVKPGQRVFLSGTTAFWLNAFFDIPQVRGGVDQAATDREWREAVWEIREGSSPEKSLLWLRKMAVDYLVVHTDGSEEFYHDFRDPDKFEGQKELEKIYESNGDRIYQLSPN